jgi:hypothetical protein
LSSIQTTLIGKMASPSAIHGSFSLAAYGNENPAPNKNTTHSGEPLKKVMSFSQSTPYPGPSLEPNCRLPIGPYPGRKQKL